MVERQRGSSPGRGAAPRPVPAFGASVTVCRDFIDRNSDLERSPSTTTTSVTTHTHPSKMADNTKHTKNAINAKRQEIAQEEAQRAEWADSVGSRTTTITS